MIPDYDERLDALTSKEFWLKFHAVPDYPSPARLAFIKDPVMRQQLAELHGILLSKDWRNR